LERGPHILKLITVHLVVNFHTKTASEHGFLNELEQQVGRLKQPNKGTSTPLQESIVRIVQCGKFVRLRHLEVMCNDHTLQS